MGKVKYDLKASKEAIGPLYPRLLDKEGREIDGFHREEADSDWPTTQLEHIDTDVKYWTARIVANTHRRSISEEEREEELIELAKALRAEGHEGSLVKIISELTTFSEQLIRGFLPDLYKMPSMAREIAKPSFATEQKSKRKSREQTSDKEKLENLYKKVERSAFTGQGNTSQKIEGAKELGLEVSQYEKNLVKIKETLKDSWGRRYADVKDVLKEAYTKSTEMKKSLTEQINAEKERIEKATEELRNKLKPEVTDEVIKMTEKDRSAKLLENIPEEFEEVKEWVQDGQWSAEKILEIILDPETNNQLKTVLEKGSLETINDVKKGIKSLKQTYQNIHKKEKQVERDKSKAALARTGKTKAQIKKQDCKDFLNELNDKSVDLLLTDPLYYTDVDDIKSFVDSWLDLALSKIKDTGQAYIFIGAYAIELKTYLIALENGEGRRFGAPQILVWTYKNTIGPKPDKQYKRNWHAILYLRGPQAPDLNCVDLVEQNSVQEFNAPDGRQEKKYHKWQKPIELAKRLITHGSDKDSFVIDPFAGSGTFLLAAAELGRENLGVDIDEETIQKAVERGCVLYE